MGHRPFETPAKRELPKSETRDVEARFEKMHLNGLQRVTQEHQETAERMRRNIRDRISSRMGELLLHGHTMLNAYCDRCSGILMEDRGGVRQCVTCDMMNAELSRGESDRTAVTNTDTADNLSDIPTEQTTDGIAEERGNSESSPQFFAGISPMRSVTDRRSQSDGRSVATPTTLRRRNPALETSFQTRTVSLRSVGVESALKAVDDKLKWCAERLDNCENLDEVLQLYQAIERGVGILERFVSI